MPTLAQDVQARSEPVVHVQVQTDGGKERVDLADRLISFTFEDSDNRTDKASLQLENWDLSFFNSPLVVKGALIDVSWGYPDRMAVPRTLVVRKVKGFTTLHVEAHAKSVLLNRQQKCRVFEQMSRSAIAEQIAQEHGFSGPTADIEDTEEVFECINQAGETDARFLQRLARREGFRFYVDQTGFHWHRRRFDQAPLRTYRYFTDPGQGDILSISLDNDVFAKPGRAMVKGRDPRRKKTISVSGSDGETARTSLADEIEIVDPETGTTSLEKRNATQSVRYTAAATDRRAKREADARYRESIRKTLQLRLRVVGDPEQTAKRIIVLEITASPLAGKYYVKSIKTVIAPGNYTMEMTIIKDGTGRLAKRVTQARASAARRNREKERDKNKLRQIELVDGETGRTRVAYRRS